MKKHVNRRRFLEISVGTAAVVAGLEGTHAFAQTAVSTSITLDGSGTGLHLDGIGALSGGGGNSRLLYDYPEPYRSQILDYLFKPNYGASLQILKVEVGSDANSTDGAEACFMRTPTEQNFNRGYEWWLMQQAKARNPSIKLYGLAWGAPGWIGTTGAKVFDTTQPVWSQDMVNYYIAWIKGAKSQYNLTIDYIGGWNERGYNEAFYEALHSAIKSNGLSTLVVGDDTDWKVVDGMTSDAAFNAAVDVIGVHYNCGGGYGANTTKCSSSASAEALGKPIWGSENGSQDYNAGAFDMARVLNSGYIDAKMTAYINWPLIAALYPNLYFSTVGLMVANQPWTGNYSIGKLLWVTGHTTQFAQPGWQYITSSCGFLGGARANGSYVTLKSTNGKDYSVIIQTVDATANQTVSFHVTNGLSTDTVHVWSSNLSSSKASDFFVQQTSITPSGGTYSLTLQPGYIYSLTTTTGQSKGTVAAPPAAKPLSLPYTDNFDSYTISRQARYFSDMYGAFEIAQAGAGRSGRVMRQVVTIAPIPWESPSDPFTLFGDISWTNYTVKCDVLLEQAAGYIELMGRMNTQETFQRNFTPAKINGYHLHITYNGAWSIRKSTTTGTTTTLLSGTVAALGTSTWHTLALTFNGTKITAQINAVTVGTATDSSYSAGQIGFGVSSWQNAQFDNLSIA